MSLQSSDTVHIKSGLKKIGFWLLIVFIAGFNIMTLFIGLDIRYIARIAVDRYEKDTVTALIELAGDEACLLHSRDKAIWALGQLADASALPMLESLYTGEPCDHKTKICQYELEKAIKHCKGGPSIFRGLWRALFIKT